jgi:hypothetical protein
MPSWVKIFTLVLFVDKMKKVVFIFLIFYLNMQICAQTKIHLNNSHNPTGKKIAFVVDGLRLDSTLFVSCQLEKSDIKNIHVDNQKPEIIVVTTLLIVLDDKFLATNEEKEKLSIIDMNDICSILKIGKEEGLKSYGEKGKKGVLVVKTIYGQTDQI